jgi:hypothetical protein
VTDAAPTVDPAEPTPTVVPAEASPPSPGAEPIGAVPPYAPSWLDLLIAAIGRLPGPSLLAFLAIGVVILAAIYGLAPLSGQGAAIGLALTYYAVLLPAALWLFGYLNGVASTALDAFLPLLDGAEADIDRLRYELTVVPAGGAWLLLAVVVPLTIVGYLLFPEAEGIVGLSPLAMGLRLPYEIVTTAVGFVILYRTVRQLRLVHRIHAMTLDIDLYRPTPLYAFSSFTAQAGMSLFLLLVPLALLVPGGSGPGAYAVAATWFAVLAVISVATFVLPLQGMHAQIVAHKAQLEAAVGLRLKATVEAIHHAVDVADLSTADGLNKTLASLIAERDLIEKLPTWPWRPGTIGAFATAMVLPIAIWLATRLLERIV